MADDSKDCGVVNLALHRIARRYAGTDVARLAGFLAGKVRRNGDMGTSEIIEHLIRSIENAERRGVTRYQLAQRTGIPQSTLSRLMNRERDSLKIETVEALCAELGYTLEMRKNGSASDRRSGRRRR